MLLLTSTQNAALECTIDSPVRLTGSTTFRANRAYWGGAIYNVAANEEFGLPAAVTTFPADAVFVDNMADVRKGVMLILFEPPYFSMIA